MKALKDRIQDGVKFYFQLTKMGVKADLAIYGAAKRMEISEASLKEELGFEG